MFIDPVQLPPVFRDRVLLQARFRGTGRALLSTRRSMPADSLPLYRNLAATRKPVLIVWGREDRITPFVQLEDAVATMPGAEVLVVDRAGHAAQYERPEVVNPAVAEFLRRG
jgi:pimeloyl-ACP methyl ester carboxylesterase